MRSRGSKSFTVLLCMPIKKEIKCFCVFFPTVLLFFLRESLLFMEKSPGPGLFIDFTDFWSRCWNEGKEVKEERLLPFIFKNTNNRNTNDWRGERSQTKATPECWCSHGFLCWGPLVPPPFSWSTLSRSDGTLAWRRTPPSLWGESGIHHFNDRTLLKHFCQSCCYQESWRAQIHSGHEWNETNGPVKSVSSSFLTWLRCQRH